MQLGDTVRVKPTYRYAADWRGQFVVIGLKLDRFGRVDVTIATGKDQHGDWDQPTDGFLADELEVVSAPEVRPLNEHEAAGFWGFVNSIGR